MAKVGIGRSTLVSLIGQVGLGEGTGLNERALGYIADAIAKAIDENNVRLELNLESAGVRLTSND